MLDNTVQIDNRDEIVVNLLVLVRRVWRELRRRALIILLLMAIAGAAFYVGARVLYKPVYTANATFMINRASGLKYKTGSEKYAIINRTGALFPFMIKSDTMKNIVMDDLGYPDASDFDIAITSTTSTGSNVIALSVKSGNPQLAYDALQSVLRNQARVTEPAIGEVELKMISEGKVPGSPSTRPDSTKKAVGGMLLAFIAALIFVVIKCIFARTIYTGEELSGVLGAELLGELPFVKHAHGKKPAAFDSEDCPAEMIEAIRRIRLRLERISGERNAKTIMITSTISSEGKTITAANLAVALAAHQKKVLLVDGNFRNPSIFAALDMPQTEKGMADILAGSCEPGKVMIPYTKDNGLTLLAGGALKGQPSALWSSPVAERLFGEWRENFDYILIDSTAAGSCSESGLIASLADGCIYVGQADRLVGFDVRKGADAVASAGCEIIGCVLNADH